MSKERGFTLLEVIVSLTIIGLALGTLFSLLAGNKKLAVRTSQITDENIAIRYLINYQQLPSATDETLSDKSTSRGTITDLPPAEDPDRKTQRIRFQLSSFEIKGKKLSVRSTRWKEYDHEI
ncbi:MAG: type II secretion system protein [Gammaproteobacteria bacterium]|nr:type II secretion system protein [Gammaproteobacteria bacterium]